MNPPEAQPSPRSRPGIRLFDLLLLLVLLTAAFFRFSGLDWGEYQYLHPDERFLIWVGSDISPVSSLGEYFDTQNSTLNPHNRGHGFYVYGTLPMFITRYVVQWVYGHSGFQEMTDIGRTLSALADLLTVALVYVIASRLYGRRVALLASAFSAAAVLQIQQSHFFTMDTFLTLFMLLAFYFAVRVSTVGYAAYRRSALSNSSPAFAPGAQAYPETPAPEDVEPAPPSRLPDFVSHPLFLLSLGFGAALGMAVASKLNAAPIAATLPLALVIAGLRLPRHERERFALQAGLYLALAAVVSVIVFRIFQPYAFSGPGFFGVTPNPRWVDNIRSLQNQTAGDVDFPPAMQWARRSIFFSGQNMVLWGLGLPLGILAWAGFLWAAWRSLLSLGQPARLPQPGEPPRHAPEWQRHALIVIWTGAYFGWQSLNHNPTLRYQLPIYPLLAIFAAWAVIALYDRGRAHLSPEARQPHRSRLWQAAAVVAGGSVLLATYAYAYAFTGVYTRPITRLEASRWVYEHLPGPISLIIQSEQGQTLQSLPFPYEQSLGPGQPYVTQFQPRTGGVLQTLHFPHVAAVEPDAQAASLTATLSDQPFNENPLARGSVTIAPPPAGGSSLGEPYTLQLDQPVQLEEGRTYYLLLETGGPVSSTTLDAPVTLRIASAGDNLDQQVSGMQPIPLQPGMPVTLPVEAAFSGLLTGVHLPPLQVESASAEPLAVRVLVLRPEDSRLLAAGQAVYRPGLTQQGVDIAFDALVPIQQQETYLLQIELESAGEHFRLYGTALANEGDWDDPVPWRMDMYDPFGGLYPPDLNFHMYWEDNPEKRERFVRILHTSEYIAITSNRQWGSLPRIPERFPLVTAYYRSLLGCPLSESIQWCYNVAEPGMFSGQMGYELVQTFTSYPQLGPLELNTQFAEEAFTVYDHPKVFIFRKTADYDPQRVERLLGAVDLTRVVNRPPGQMGSYPATLMLPADRLEQLREGGTWSDLFSTQALHNRYPALGVVLWYAALLLLGLAVYPLLRLALPGLPDRGYPVARIAGLLLFSYTAWLLGSARVPVTQGLLGLLFVLLLGVGAIAAWFQRRALAGELRLRWRYFLSIEGLFLAFFLFDLLIRIANPDLWHPAMGGEKPMDFAYFNAVIRSEIFPPYDPWQAGGYLNYYYYGFVLVGMLTKLLGILPAVAFNLIFPTMFAMLAMGAFSAAWNLLAARLALPALDDEPAGSPQVEIAFPPPAAPNLYWRGLVAALLMAVMGNLGTVRMLWRGYQQLGSSAEAVAGSANLITRMVWAFRGFFESLSGGSLPYALHHWYWIPSRAIDAQGDVEPITEFPFFTVLYADPHAHLYALPLSLLAVAFIISVVRARLRWSSPLAAALGFGLGGLAIGALRPTNTWDFYPYLALGVVAVLYSALAYYTPSPALLRRLPALAQIPPLALRLIAAAAGAALLVGLAHLLFQPYAAWYGAAYTEVGRWEGPTTSSPDFLVHWGVFLFLIITWLAWETIEWMADTPLTALRRLEALKAPILVSHFLLAAGVLLLMAFEVRIAWLALPLAAWAGALILRPGQPDSKRLALFLIGTGFFITMLVEVIVLKGDIARMNTVFKFYLQAWTLFSIAAAAGLGWVAGKLRYWSGGLRSAWQAVLGVLFAAALLYTLTATLAKVEDRFTQAAPPGLDGMRYMQYATYFWDGEMILNQDYAAIRWLQENVEGSPVIVETASPDGGYRWAARMSIYTGLPTVAGWEWHQMQQRAVNPAFWVSARVQEVGAFYTTTDLDSAFHFLEKYDVRYIIVGQYERNKFPGPGLDKFPQGEGQYWRTVFSLSDTVIYEVLEP
jgi:YYY domain-containing protein